MRTGDGYFQSPGGCRQLKAVVRSVTDPSLQVRALAEITQALAEAGQYQRAVAAATRAEAIARSIGDQGSYADALAEAFDGHVASN